MRKITCLLVAALLAISACNTAEPPVNAETPPATQEQPEAESSEHEADAIASSEGALQAETALFSPTPSLHNEIYEAFEKALDQNGVSAVCAFLIADGNTVEVSPPDIPKPFGIVKWLGAYEEYILAAHIDEGESSYLFTYNFPMDTMYRSTWGYQYDMPYDDAKVLDNGMVVLYGRTVSRDLGTAEWLDFLPTGQPVFLDLECNLLDFQLDFEYGQEYTYDSRVSTEYRILALDYHTNQDKYVAVFSADPYYGTNDVERDGYGRNVNITTEFGIATFDRNGKQLERYLLDGATHHYYLGYYRGARPPKLIQISENMVAIVPQIDYEREIPGKRQVQGDKLERYASGSRATMSKSSRFGIIWNKNTK